MVRALLDGTKTQTRRIVKPQPDHIEGECWTRGKCALCPQAENGLRFPYDRLWVKETFEPDISGYFYRADYANGKAITKWTPAIFMPRSASRITLEITDVRVERLQDISEVDAKAEGVDGDKWAVHYYCDEGDPEDPEDFGVHRCNWRFGYKMLWNSINAKTAPWESNPWVWVIGFRKL